MTRDWQLRDDLAREQRQEDYWHQLERFGEPIDDAAESRDLEQDHAPHESAADEWYAAELAARREWRVRDCE